MATIEFPSQAQDSQRSPARAHATLERRAKIVCTVGPASNSEAMLRQLLRLGMDVARLNFSHGTHEEHARVIERLRRAAAKEGRTVCIMQDLQGPKIRTGRLRDRRPIVLKARSRVTITPRNLPGTASLITTSFRGLSSEVAPGSPILLSDGTIELRVISINGEDVNCEVVNGGVLGEHQGINLPGTPLRVPAVTEKDRHDLEFGLRHGVDMVALSFVRTAQDVREAKQVIGRRRDDVPVIAKLEKPQAIEHLEEILEVSDGVMVARGDLGVEVPPEQVPIMQKHIIRRAAEWRKPVITATQMLESMVESPRPTRAEASDVANAVIDGSDAVMLSKETATGKYPREAVSMMGRIVVEAEAYMCQAEPSQRRRERRSLSIAETICESVAHAAADLDMRAIAIFTQTGNTARMVSKYRPRSAIYAFARREAVCNRLNLMWGVHPVLWQQATTAEEMMRGAEKVLLERRVARVGEVIAVVSGTSGAGGPTNLMRLHVIGENGPRPERRRDTGLRREEHASAKPGGTKTATHDADLRVEHAGEDHKR